VSLAALAGAYMWTFGPALNFMSAFGFGIGGAIWFTLSPRIKRA